MSDSTSVRPSAVDKAAAHLAGFCRQVAYDGIVPSLAWFSEAAETVDALRAELARLRGPAAVSEAPLHELDVKWLLDQTRVLLEQEHRRGETVDTCSAASCTRWRELKVRLRGADPGVRPDAPEGK